MSFVGQPERATQNRVIALFIDELDYRYLGDRTHRDGNSNIEEALLTEWLTWRGYSTAQINAALYKLRTEANNHSRNLYGNNQAVYKLLRYGVPVKIDAGKVTVTVYLIDWQEPKNNDFVIVEEVTLLGSHQRRIDLVLYVNGIAVAVLELKNSRVSIGDGIRQSLSNQQPEFNEWFFSTVQFVFAGNDSEGLRYGSIGTEEKYFLTWKECEQDNSRFKLDKYLLKMCSKRRLIELMYNFVLFDGGIKKLPRVHQYFGFTGTPLLKKDKATSLEVFGGYIHTYKFNEAVEDGVILDLLYEARDINQRLTSQESVDEWFEIVSKDLNDWQKEELKKQWGTLQVVLSSESRMRKVVQDIIKDFRKRPRLSNGNGNALLVASSIYEACKYYTLLQKTPFKGKCAVVTSYNPQAQDVTKEETGANSETDKQFIYNTYNELLKPIETKPGMGKTETYEEQAKSLFIKEPANMKLLVVDKLLTGFDAPPCTYLYIDKSMQDHGLFQSICRTNINVNAHRHP